MFDTSQNQTTVSDDNPALPWKGGRLPKAVPENTDGNTHMHTKGIKVEWILMTLKLHRGLETVNSAQHSVCWFCHYITVTHDDAI